MANRSHVEEIEAQAAMYALGSLPADEAKHFEQRVSSGCPLCGAELHDCRRVVMALPLAAEEVAPPASLRSRLLESVNSKAAAAKPKEGLLVRAGDTPWEPLPVPGVEMRRLFGKKTFLVRMAPRTSLPAHDHPAAEQCLVLEGSVRSDDVTAHAGDYLYMPAGSTHQPLYSEEGCLFLIAYT